MSERLYCMTRTRTRRPATVDRKPALACAHFNSFRQYYSSILKRL